jgi:hypothetical protein
VLSLRSTKDSLNAQAPLAKMDIRSKSRQIHFVAAHKDNFFERIILSDWRGTIASDCGF